jgi:hypothetical protein
MQSEPARRPSQSASEGRSWGKVLRASVAGSVRRRGALLDGASRTFLTADGAAAGRTVANRAGRARRTLDGARAREASLDHARRPRRTVIHEAGDLAGAEGASRTRPAFADVASSPAAQPEIADRVATAAVEDATSNTAIDVAVVAVATGTDATSSIARAQVTAGALARAFQVAAAQAARDRARATLARHGAAAGLAAVHIADRTLIAGGLAVAARRCAVSRAGRVRRALGLAATARTRERAGLAG